MTEETPLELRDFDFPEIGNNQQNIWRLRDELNATRRWIRENTVTPEYEEEEEPTGQRLREGVTITKNGRYSLKGVGFIKESEAYI
jgi:hypothetical protein